MFGHYEFIAVGIRDKEYPPRLRNIKGAPFVLYVKGDLSLLNPEKAIAVVGTRELEDIVDVEAGKAAVQRFLNEGYVIVSGLAKGCDTVAHSYTVEHGGRTIAVLGTPLDKYYPKENRELQDKIAEEHLLVSQYPIGTKTQGYHFAHRNLTTVALSDAVVIIRASDRSGTQHAIRHCLEQGKPLYVLKNNLNQGYEWTRKLQGRFELI